jgi:four helix bundle protein
VRLGLANDKKTDACPFADQMLHLSLDICKGGAVEVLFDHEKLDAYQAALQMVSWVETQLRDIELTVAARDHLRRASESIVRNLVRANNKRTPADRAKIFDVAYGSGLECAACLDVLCTWEAMEVSRAMTGKALLDRIVAMLIGLRTAKERQVCEPRCEYSVESGGNAEHVFAHERLRVYQSALRFVNWSAKLIRSETLGLAKGRDLDRHSTGVVLNIAEGNGKFSIADRTRFLHIASSSALQAASSLDIMAARSAITGGVACKGKEHLAEIVCMIGALARSLG